MNNRFTIKVTPTKVAEELGITLNQEVDSIRLTNPVGSTVGRIEGSVLRLFADDLVEKMTKMTDLGTMMNQQGVHHA